MLPAGARFRTLLLVALFAAASVAIAGGLVEGFSSGVDEEKDKEGGATTTLLAGGCSCHNPQYTGNVRAVLEGVPSFYAFGGKVDATPANITVRIVGGPNASGSNQGGFNLQVTQGTLGVPQGAADVQILNDQATHTTQGNDQREWKVTWTPPAQAGPDAIFYLTVNSVNGNGFNDEGDEWGRGTYVAMGANRLGAGAAAEEGGGIAAIRALGVNFYAYWVGVISFVVLFVVIAATFFLLRYGESRHWTDQKDRPAREKTETPKPMTGTWVVLAIVLIVFVVAAVQVVRTV
ncbi:MAG TPA: choice-of-anchor V domain-containing protein [Candidatus Thermoplasmatota archaeon]|jgi:hypothetical protein|nr:choice-of-anchor V domain-containing protein [Candidatus Thermoplasmatota archaeon]